MLEKIYQIEKPNTSIENVSDLSALSDLAVKIALEKTEIPEYLNWKDLKYKTWIPEPFVKNKQRFWALVKLYRKIRSKKTVIQDTQGRIFTWIKLGYYEEMLHGIDIDMSKYLSDFPNINDSDRQKYQLKGLLEEAIASSQLEGAHATRKVAKQMIQEKREPRNKAEKMILNNYITMKAIQEKFKNSKLSIEVLFELHSLLTEGTLAEEDIGKFRSDDDKVVVQKGDAAHIVSYIAPPTDFLNSEIAKFIAFANDELPEEEFVHPLIKAIMLHFWMGLLHPFVDGNGRLARGLFYWYLLKKGYWAFAFLPISIAIKTAPAQYGEAYILSEQDDNDLTYFIDYHIRKINVAIENFKVYIKDKNAECEQINKVFYAQKSLNRRQVELLVGYKSHKEHLVNITTYIHLFHITKATAIKDLKGLVDQGYLTTQRKGKNVYYYPAAKIDTLHLS